MKKKKRYIPATSGDALVDWWFRTILATLNEEVDDIKWIHDLRDPDVPNEKLNGWFIDDEILLDDILSSTKAPKMLIHETLHALIYLGSLEEDYIKDCVKIIWERFTKKQKTIIRWYLPQKPQCEECKKTKQKKQEETEKT